MANSANGNHIGGVSAQSYTQYFQAEKQKMGVSEIQEIARKLFKSQLEHTQNRPLNIEVIEDTLLIDASVIGKRKSRKKKRQEREKKKKQRPKKRVYSRAELEVLRFDNLDAQKKTWAAVYGGLRPMVAAEYDGLLASPSTVSDRRPHYGGKAATAMGRRNHLEYICAVKNC